MRMTNSEDLRRLHGEILHLRNDYKPPFHLMKKVDDEYRAYMQGLNGAGYYPWLALAVRLLKPKRILELGNYHGASTIMIYSELPRDAELFVSVDVERDIRFVPEQMLKDPKMRFVFGNDLDLNIYGENVPGDFDFVFIDTLHLREHLEDEWAIYQHLCKPGALVALDDIGQNDLPASWDSLSYPKLDLTRDCHPSGFGIFVNLPNVFEVSARGISNEMPATRAYRAARAVADRHKQNVHPNEPDRADAISVVIVTFNSENYFAKCLAAVEWAEEIIVMDLGSVDRTLEIAQSHNCRVMRHEWVPIAEFVRREAIEACQNDWILVLDPDEVIPESLARELRRIATADKVDAVSIPRKNYIFGHWMQHSGWQNDRHARFFRKGAVSYHAQAHRQDIIRGRVLELPAEEGDYMLHHNYDNVFQFVEKLNRYTTLEADQLLGQTEDMLVSGLARQHFNTIRSRFFRSEGYKDGLQGLAACELMGSYSTVAYAKAIEKKGWPEKDSQALLSLTRYGILLGMWDLLMGMEGTAERASVRIFYRLLRGAVSVVLRLRAF